MMPDEREKPARENLGDDPKYTRTLPPKK